VGAAMIAPAGSGIGPERLFERLVDVLLPKGGYVMSLFEAYFDESADGNGKGLYAVSGYLFRAEQAKITDQKWKAVLDRYRLPYFHMVDCAHGNPPFNRLTKTERISVVKEVIALTTHAEFGVSAIVNPVRFSKIHTQADPYIFCVDILVLLRHRIG
jgi:hypothetical protein